MVRTDRFLSATSRGCGCHTLTQGIARRNGEEEEVCGVQARVSLRRTTRDGGGLLLRMEEGESQGPQPRASSEEQQQSSKVIKE